METWAKERRVRSPVTKLAKVETQTEPKRQRPRVTLQVQSSKAKLTAHSTEAEVGIRKTAVEPVRPRTAFEPEGRWSPVKPKGWRAEVQRQPRIQWWNQGDV